MIGFVDLHLHTTASDGTLTPAETVAEAISCGLHAISITDHDTVAGVAAAQQAADRRLHVLPGVEMSTELGAAEVHILGYLVDCGNQRLLDAFERSRQGRVSRAREIVDRLRSLGLRINYEQVAEVAGEGTVGRPHIARVLVSEGLVRSQAEAFSRFLRRGRPAYAARLKMLPEQAIEVVRGAGGAAVLAHPGLVRDRTAVERILELGVDGIEAYHSEHSDAATRTYLRVAAERGLLVTGGSDSHGPRGPAPVKIGSVEVPDSCADGLIRWAERHEGELETGV